MYMTKNKIENINAYLDVNHPNFLGVIDFQEVCQKFNEDLFGDAEDSKEVFEATLGQYGYQYSEAPTF